MDKCFICGGELKLFTSVNKNQIFKCQSCGLGITKNPTVQKDDYHRDDSYIIEEKLFKNIFQKRVNIISKFKRGGTVLEVGCSNGLMLSLLKKRGWDALGVEMSKKAAQAARDRGVEIIEGDFRKIKMNRKFDLIIFNHTLEHLDKPAEIVRKAVDLLNKDGLLYIDLPNFGGVGARVFKGRWPSLLPKEHLWHFTEQSETEMLKKFNMKKIYVTKSSGIFDYSHPIYGIFLSLFTFKKRFFQEVITAIPSYILSIFNQGSDLMMIYRKK